MVMLNRVLGSTTGTDVEFIELIGTPGETLAGLSVVVTESDDQADTGAIDFRIDLPDGAAIGDNGFYLIGNDLVQSQYGVTPDLTMAGSIENSSYTIAIVETDSISGETVAEIGSVIDAVGVTDGGATDTFFFDAPVVGPDGSFLPAGFNRVPDGSDTFELADFFLGDGAPRNSGNGETPVAAELAIYEIQGSGLESDYQDQSVVTSGIVTAVDSNGFFLQDAEGDGDAATSDAIFVFTGAAPAVAIGDAITLEGTVAEWFPSGAESGNQPTTQISASNDTISVESSGNDLPSAVLIGGPDGRQAPDTTLSDGIAFFESMEGMLVTAQDLLAVSPTSRFDEIFAVTQDENGEYPDLSDRGALPIGEADFNPERIQIDEDSRVFNFDFPHINTGAYLGDVTGVISYDFGNYQIVPTEDFTGQIVESEIEPEITELTGGKGKLTIATYNVLNLDPVVEDVALTPAGSSRDVDDDVGNGRFDAIAQQIVANLGSPDILGLQEIQDSNGAQIFDALGNIDGVNSASETLELLIAAIAAAGGPVYEYIETPDMPQTYFDDEGNLVRPVGGQPGGDIRNAFLYNPEQVSFVEGSLDVITDGDGDEFPFFEGRIPLVATFDYNGEEVTVVNVHLSSKSGSAPIMGVDQPFDTDAAQEDPNFNGSVDQRQQQADAVVAYIEALGADANVVVLGDFNEFEFVGPVETFEAAGLTNTTNLLDEDERYTFVFGGNSQSLDHILVSESLAGATEVDIVHVNAEFASTDERASDHDPVIIQIDFTPTANDDQFRGVEGQEFVVDLLANDDNPGGGDLSIVEINGIAMTGNAIPFVSKFPGGRNWRDFDSPQDYKAQLVGYSPRDFGAWSWRNRYSEDGEYDLRALYDIEGNLVYFEIVDGRKVVGKIEINGDGTLTVKSDVPIEDLDLTYKVSDGTLVSDEAEVSIEILDEDDVFTLQLLHLADQEAAAAAVKDAPNLSAVLNALRDADFDADATLTLSSGDAFIPGLFFDASEAVFGSEGIADILIQNELGVQAIALGNHEFDYGTGLLADLISGDIDGGVSFDGTDFTGAAFPYLSANLDFSTDGNLAPLAVAGGGSPLANTVTSSVVIEQDGELFGVVGATTPTLASISSPDGVTVMPDWAGTTPTAEELAALAAIIQGEVDALLAANPTLDKVILMAHMQQISIEFGLAELLEGVDIIIAGGSNTRLFDENDRARDGDSVQGEYPTFIEGADGNYVAVVNTDGSYKYVGNLVIDFDANGNIIPGSYDADVSGAYATDDQGVADLGAEGLIDPEIQEIADQIEAQILATEGNVLGVSDVFLNGNRSGTGTADDPDGVRTQETNLGNLTADANLAYANEVFDGYDVLVSIKNGGGIRASIGQTVVPPGGSQAVRTVNEAIFDSLGNEVKPEGGISQNDIATTLAFNNDLVVMELTGAELVDVIEHGVSALPNVAGQFIQISGVQFSFDPSAAAGDRIVDAAIVDQGTGEILHVLVNDGELVNADAVYGAVTLGFLAGGGDSYPFPAGDEFVFLENEGVQTGAATFADDGTEQDALAEYLLDNFATADTAFDQADTGPAEDTRIQNLEFQDGLELDAAIDAFLAV